MNPFIHPHDPQRHGQALEDRAGRRLAALLTEQQALELRADIDERLRVARDQALARAREARRLSSAPSAMTVGGGTAALAGGPDGDTPWWLRLSSLLPLALLLAGMLWIDRQYTLSQIEAAVEVDAAILADDLPPEAYSDPGFAEFLKSGRR
jgi:Protein of unknown function (DUF3619)